VVLVEKMFNFAQMWKSKNFIKENRNNKSKKFQVQASNPPPKGFGANTLEIELVRKLREKGFDPAPTFENGFR